MYKSLTNYRTFGIVTLIFFILDLMVAFLFSIYYNQFLMLNYPIVSNGVNLVDHSLLKIHFNQFALVFSVSLICFQALIYFYLSIENKIFYESSSLFFLSSLLFPSILFVVEFVSLIFIGQINIFFNKIFLFEYEFLDVKVSYSWVLGWLFLPVRLFILLVRNDRYQKDLEDENNLFLSKYGTKDRKIVNNIVNGKFLNLDEYEKAINFGALTKFQLDEIISYGAPNKTTLDFLKKGDFVSYSEYLDLKEKYEDIESKRDFDLIIETQAPSLQIAKDIKNGNFVNYKEFLKAKEIGARNLTEYNLVLKFKVNDYQTVRKIINGGFRDYNELQQAENLGATNAKEVKFIFDLQAPDLITANLINELGFPTYDLYLQAKKLDLSNYKDFIIFNARNVIEQAIKTLFGQLKEGDEVNKDNSVKILYEETRIGLKEFHVDYNFVINLIREQLEKFLENNLEFEFIKLKNTLTKKSSLNHKDFTDYSQKKTKEINDMISCFNCNNLILKGSDFCSFCGTRIEKCSICKLPVKDENRFTCPNCKNIFHENHLKEFVKVKGKCPVCNLDIKDIIF
jgi:hypothetical protein